MGRSSTRPRRRLLLVHGEAFYSAMAMPLLGHDEVESEDLQLGRGDTSYSARMKLSWRVFYLFAARSSTQPQRGLLLSRSDASYSTMRRPSRKVFYFAAATAPTRPGRIQVGGFSTRPRCCLILGHDQTESEDLLLVHGEVLWSSTVRPSTRP